MTILNKKKDAFSEEELVWLFITSIEEIDRRAYGKDDEPKNNKHLMKIAFSGLEDEIKNLFLQQFGNQADFDLNNIKDLIEKFSNFKIEEQKEEVKEVIFPFGEQTRKRDIK